ncbi:T9SS type A sorting domain-containing protein [candidate division KSB1 bacterium]|nr:T9SS type A sorting domain-containing protein [candidate division KSB1 bacterium]
MNKLVRVFLLVTLAISLAGGVVAKDLAKNSSVDRMPVAAREDQPSITSAGPTQPTAVRPSKVAAKSVVGNSTYPRATCYSGRSVAVGADGAVHAAWCSNDRPDPRRMTYYAKSTDSGETWSDQIEVFDTHSGWRCAIAAHGTDPNIVAIVFSAEPEEGDTRRGHCTVSLDGGLTWQPSKSVSGSLLNIENFDIAFDKTGGLHIVYECNADNRTYWNYSADNGVTWLPQPEQIDIGSSLLATFGPVLAFDASNNPHVAWCDGGQSGYWGDKEVYWNWRDMMIGIWMEVPPPRIQASSVGLAWPSFAFDSKGVGHLVADGIEDTRHAWYRTYKNGTWSDLTEFEPIGDPAGQTAMSSISIDKNDQIYVTYGDNTIPDGTAQPWNGQWDIFSGALLDGEWTTVNLTADGPAPGQSYPDVARRVGDDGIVHLVFTEGDAADLDGSTATQVMHMAAYPWPEEPTCVMNILPDTYNGTGPFTVTASTSDIKGYVASVILTVQVNGTQVHEAEMEEIEENSWQASFSVDAKAGDAVTCFGTATDDEGYVKVSTERTFNVLAPVYPGADLLLVQQDARIDTFFTHVLDKLGYIYELWDYAEHNGIDESVTNHGWSTIFINGWVVDCVPTRGYEGNPFAAFLQGATADDQKNLLIASQDYLWANGELQGDVLFDVGDFAYDFLQLGDAVCDPWQSGDEPVEGVPENDSLLIGIDGDPVSGSFAEEPLRLVPSIADIMYEYGNNPNWIDYTQATGSGEDIFYSYNQGYGSGIKLDAGNYKTVYLPWMVDMILDSVAVDTSWTGKVNEDAVTLLQNVLTYFGTKVGEGNLVKSNSVVPKQYELAQNYPNPFNPETSIRFALPVNGSVDIDIFNSVGQKIRTLVSDKMTAGSHEVVWDGRNESGQKVSSGIYFYRLKTAQFNKTKKMIMVK